MSVGDLEREVEHWKTLAAGLGHEIRNPLSTIMLTLQLLREDAQARDAVSPGQLIHRIDLVMAEVEHLQRIVQDFLRLSRRPELNLEPEDLNELIVEVTAFLGDELAERGIGLVVQEDRSIGLVQADRPLMRQVLNNLVRNAMEAMERGGTLTIQTYRRDGFVHVDLIDTGRGIPEALRERIFDGFFSTKPGGTGIGLALSRQIVEHHGGLLSCESVPGKGTRFRLSLPEAAPPREGGE